MSFNKDNLVNISKSKLEEIESLLKSIKKEKKTYTENQTIIKNTLLEIAEDSQNTQSHLKQKLRNILLRRNILHKLEINKPGYVLDVKNFVNIEFTYEEQMEIKMKFEEKLKEKERRLIEDVNDITDVNVAELQNIIELFDFNRDEENDKILGNLHKEYIQTMLDVGDKILELLNIKNEVVPKVVEAKTKQLLLEHEKLKLRLKIMEIKSEILIFNDSPNSAQAYQLAYKDMKEQQNIYLKEIENLTCDLDKFKALLNNKEFKEIMHSYNQYVSSIDKMKWLNQQILKKETIKNA